MKRNEHLENSVKCPIKIIDHTIQEFVEKSDIKSYAFLFPLQFVWQDSI